MFRKTGEDISYFVLNLISLILNHSRQINMRQIVNFQKFSKGCISVILSKSLLKNIFKKNYHLVMALLLTYCIVNVYSFKTG